MNTGCDESDVHCGLLHPLLVYRCVQRQPLTIKTESSDVKDNQAILTTCHQWNGT